MSDGEAVAWMSASFFGSGAAVFIARIVCDYLFERRRMELQFESVQYEAARKQAAKAA